MKRVGDACVLGVLLASLAGPAQGQLGGLLDKVLAPVLRDAAPPDAPPAPPAQPSPLEQAEAPVATGVPPPVARRKGVTAELQPDRACRRPQERFDILGKAAEYGGTAASLRLEHLIRSDFRRDELTPQDRELLHYLAQTTIWVPVSVENRLAAAFAVVSPRTAGEGTPLDRAEQQAVIEQRIGQLRAAVPDFPGRIRLDVDASMPDGAAARFGGTIHLSPPFLQMISQDPHSGDLVLAHELSHVYKRHAVKLVQFRLLSTDEGWDLARKLLQRGLRGATVDPVRDGMFLVTTVPQLIGFVRSMQWRFRREQEFEADACAVVWLRTIGADPSRAWDAFIATMASNQAQAGSYAGSHPPTPEREANYRHKMSDRASGKTGGNPPARSRQRAQRRSAQPANTRP